MTTDATKTKTLKSKVERENFKRQYGEKDSKKMDEIIWSRRSSKKGSIHEYGQRKCKTEKNINKSLREEDKTRSRVLDLIP